MWWEILAAPSYDASHPSPRAFANERKKSDRSVGKLADALAIEAVLHQNEEGPARNVSSETCASASRPWLARIPPRRAPMPRVLAKGPRAEVIAMAEPTGHRAQSSTVLWMIVDVQIPRPLRSSANRHASRIVRACDREPEARLWGAWNLARQIPPRTWMSFLVCDAGCGVATSSMRRENGGPGSCLHRRSTLSQALTPRFAPRNSQ